MLVKASCFDDGSEENATDHTDPMDLDGEDPNTDFDCSSGEHDPDAILVMLLNYLSDAKMELTEEASKMEIDEEDEKVEEKGDASDLNQKVKDLWGGFVNSMETTTPAMSSDPKVKKLVVSVEELIKEIDGSTMDLENAQKLCWGVTKLLKILRPVDLGKLLTLLEQLNVSAAGKTMEGKDVLLFLGATGAGKTTTILYLAGTSFKKVKQRGQFHLKPDEFPDAQLASFHTSGGSSSATTSVQCFEVQVGGQSLVLCDVPGMSDTGGIEVEISNGFGIVHAIQQAKSVKPVLVLSEKGMGDRFTGVKSVLDTITKLIGGQANAEGLESFSYLFTKYDKEYQDMLWEQFADLKSQDGTIDSAPLLAMIDDIISKTNPMAQLILPLDGDAPKDLSKVWDGKRLNPKNAFKTFVPKESEALLMLQLQYSVSNIEQALKSKRFQGVQRTLEQLRSLSQLLPDFTGPFEQAQKAIANSFFGIHCLVSANVGKFKNVLEHKTFADDLEQLKDELQELDKFEKLRWTCIPDEPSAESTRSKAIQEVTEAVRTHLRGPGDAVDSDTFLAKEAFMLDELRRLKVLKGTFGEDEEALRAYDAGANVLVLAATTCLQDAESCMEALPDKLGRLGELYRGYVRMRDYLETHCITVDIGSLEQGWNALIEKLSERAKRCMDEVESARAEIAELIKKGALGVLDLSSQKQNRAFLVGLQTSTCISDTLPGPLIEQVRRAASCFDGEVRDYFVFSVQWFKAAARDKKDLSRISCEECLHEKQKVGTLLDAFICTESQLRGFRQWSHKIGDETCDLSMHLDEVRPELFAYNTAVNASLESLEKEGEAVTYEAKVFLQRLKSGREEPVILLRELSNNRGWDKWEQAKNRSSKLRRSKRKTTTNAWTPLTSITGWLGLGSARNTVEAQKDESGEIETTLGEILSFFQRRIRLASKSISSAEGKPLLLLKQKAGSVSTVVAFLQLHRDGCSLCKAILEEPGLSQEVANAEDNLGRALKSIKSISNAWLGNKQFGAIADVLQTLQLSSVMIEQLLGLALKGGTSQRRRTLIESIRACPTYEALRNDAIGAAIANKREVFGLSFVDDARLDSANEQDRRNFYKQVLLNLIVAVDAASLVDHAESERTRLDLQSMHDECCQCVVEQTKKLGVGVSQLLAAFPEKTSDFKGLNIGLENLGSINRVFKDGGEQTIADLAVSLIGDAERILAGRLDSFADSLSPNKPEDLLKPLLRMKEASSEIHRCSEKINKAIDRILLETPKETENVGRFVLGLAAELEKLANSENEKAIIAKKLLNEHKCFAFATNAVFNAATAKQDIDWVVKHMRVSVEHQKQLKAMHEEFSRQYKDIVLAGLRATLGNRRDDFLNSLCSEARVVADDLSMEYEAQLICLTAHTFGFWTLYEATEMQLVGDTVSTEGDEFMKRLKKPHPAQVVAVWTMLNYKEKENQALQNQLCEVKTGEGKSIVLGVTATILAMMGCDVDCICYSNYLSTRDYSDFEEMFRRFGCHKHINYNTVDDLVGKEIKDIWKLGANVMLEKASGHDTCRNSNRLRILLIDEVDVLFKKDFFGDSFNPITTCHRELLVDLAQFIWSNLQELRRNRNVVEALLHFRPANQFLNAFEKDVHPLIQQKMGEMVWDAELVSKGENHPYCVQNHCICYKEFDGVTDSTYYRFQTMFAYVKEHGKDPHKITRASMEQGMNLCIECGKFSYAELPVNFDVILGVTGTLKGLRQAEKVTLQSMYNLKNFCYVPSVYGENKLKFASESSSDVILCGTSDEHCFEIAAEIDRRVRPMNGTNQIRRPVIVFFRTKEALTKFNNSSQARVLKQMDGVTVQTITEEVDPGEKEGFFSKATRAGVVSLCIRDYGRGTDFKCFDNMVLSAGGVHVIQAFYSTDYSEFIQMKGRAARQGADGSYSLVLNPDDLREDLQITSEDIASMRNQSTRCAFLDGRQEKQFRKEHKQLLQRVQEAESMHYRTTAFIEAAKANLRKEALDFLFEVNGVAGRFKGAFKGNGAKERYVKQRKSRVEAHNKRQQERRRRERNTTDTHDAATPPLLAAKDGTHYSVLGVERNATKREIVRAFRRLALVYHPDRNTAPNAATLFLRIQEAKEVLLCDATRAAYDRGLA